MRPRRSPGALTASPVLVGAVTILVAIVAVFLSYNANTALPFVPTYDLKAYLPKIPGALPGPQRGITTVSQFRNKVVETSLDAMGEV